MEILGSAPYVRNFLDAVASAARSAAAAAPLPSEEWSCMAPESVCTDAVCAATQSPTSVASAEGFAERLLETKNALVAADSTLSSEALCSIVDAVRVPTEELAAFVAAQEVGVSSGGIACERLLTLAGLLRHATRPAAEHGAYRLATSVAASLAATHSGIDLDSIAETGTVDQYERAMTEHRRLWLERFQNLDVRRELQVGAFEERAVATKLLAAHGGTVTADGLAANTLLREVEESSAALAAWRSSVDGGFADFESEMEEKHARFERELDNANANAHIYELSLVAAAESYAHCKMRAFQLKAQRDLRVTRMADARAAKAAADAAASALASRLSATALGSAVDVGIFARCEAIVNAGVLAVVRAQADDTSVPASVDEDIVAMHAELWTDLERDRLTLSQSREAEFASIASLRGERTLLLQKRDPHKARLVEAQIDAIERSLCDTGGQVMELREIARAVDMAAVPAYLARGWAHEGSDDTPVRHPAFAVQVAMLADCADLDWQTMCSTMMGDPALSLPVRAAVAAADDATSLCEGLARVIGTATPLDAAALVGATPPSIAVTAPFTHAEAREEDARRRALRDEKIEARRIAAIDAACLCARAAAAGAFAAVGGSVAALNAPRVDAMRAACLCAKRAAATARYMIAGVEATLAVALEQVRNAHASAAAQETRAAGASARASDILLEPRVLPVKIVKWATSELDSAYTATNMLAGTHCWVTDGVCENETAAFVVSVEAGSTVARFEVASYCARPYCEMGVEELFEGGRTGRALLPMASYGEREGDSNFPHNYTPRAVDIETDAKLFKVTTRQSYEDGGYAGVAILRVYGFPSPPSPGPIRATIVSCATSSSFGYTVEAMLEGSRVWVTEEMPADQTESVVVSIPDGARVESFTVASFRAEGNMQMCVEEVKGGGSVVGRVLVPMMHYGTLKGHASERARYTPTILSVATTATRFRISVRHRKVAGATPVARAAGVAVFQITGLQHMQTKRRASRGTILAMAVADVHGEI